MKSFPDGLFISFEGTEGAGKSTQIRLLTDVFQERGYNVLNTREPGGTPLGEELRKLIKHFGGPDSVCDEAELLMFGASRAQLMDRIIRPHLESGGIVLCDRFADSTTAYQGVARGMDMTFIQQLHDFSIRGRWPDTTILLDISVKIGMGRARDRSAGNPVDRIEAESLKFHRMVQHAFLDIASKEPKRFLVLSGNQPVDVLHEVIIRILDDLHF